MKQSIIIVGAVMIVVAAWEMLQPSSVMLSAENAMGNKIRKAVVAGRFYPESARELTKEVDGYLSQTPAANPLSDVRALIVPHAGYVYSGAVAGKGFASLDNPPKRIFILASNHSAHAPYFRFSIPDVSHYETPLGTVRVSPIAQSLLAESLIDFVPEAHSTHIVEVQLPFLQRKFAGVDFEIVPIITGSADESEVGQIAELLDGYVDEQSLLVVSSDLSHYYPYDKAVSLDTQCIQAFEALDTVKAKSCEACGLSAALIVMEIAKRHGWKGKILDYKNSGDTAGSKAEVVGYSSVAFFGPINSSGNQVDSKDRDTLLSVARKVLTAVVNGSAGTVRTEQITASPALNQKQGCFVTLKKNGKLRGCIGHIVATKPLLECVTENTISAALRDSRFDPVGSEELNTIEIEVSVLTEPQYLKFEDPQSLLAQLIPGKSGVILESGLRRSTYLPQVWEQLPGKQQFLSSLCRKGGSAANCWKSPSTRVSTYQVEHFSEKH